MYFDDYQDRAMVTRIQPTSIDPLAMWALGLSGEVGEFVEKVKKIFRDKGGLISDPDKEALAQELGDVLWYIAVLCDELGYNFSYIAEQNIYKLQKRHEENTIQGQGDNR